MRVALIQCPLWGLEMPPLNIAYLSAYLRQQGHQVLVLDLNVRLFHEVKPEYRDKWLLQEGELWSNEILMQELINHNEQIIDEYVDQVIDNSDVIGFGIFNSSQIMSTKMARKIKQKSPDKFIIFGGPHTRMGKELRTEKSVDCIVIGEGELTLGEVVERIEDGKSLDSCPGLIFPRDGTSVFTEERELIPDLDILPFPDFSDFDLDHYTWKRSLPLASSRGCFSKCVYCYEKILWKRMRFRTGENIFNEMRTNVEKYGANYFRFNDSFINGNPRQLEILSDLLAEVELPVKWVGLGRFSRSLTPEIIRKMRKAGCEGISFGVESGSQRICDLMGRGIDLKIGAKVLRDVYKADIGTVGNFMFGFPGETTWDFLKTCWFVIKNRNYFSEIYPSYSFIVIMPDTELWVNHEKFGVIINNGTLWESVDGKNTFITRLKRFEFFCRLIKFLGIKNSYAKTQREDRDFLIGDYYRFKGKLNKAIKFFKKELKKNPEKNYIHYDIGICYLDMGRFEYSAKHLGQSFFAQENKSSNFDSLNHAINEMVKNLVSLGPILIKYLPKKFRKKVLMNLFYGEMDSNWILFCKGKDAFISQNYSMAQETLQKVMDEMDKNQLEKGIWYMLGKSYFHLGDFKKAKPLLEVASSKFPRKDDIFRMLAEIASIEGDKEIK